MSTPLSELPLSELPVPSEPPQKLFAEPTKIRVKRAEMAAHMDDHLSNHCYVYSNDECHACSEEEDGALSQGDKTQ
jgi:hypothetical protein